MSYACYLTFFFFVCLCNLVIKNMLHGPYSKKTICYDILKNTCSKYFPKSFQKETNFQTNGYSLYRKRNNKLCKNYYNLQI